MSGHGEKLSRKQDTAIAALLSCGTITAAAEAVGIGEATLRRWMSEPAFASAYADASRQVFQSVLVGVQTACTAAVETLLAVMQDTENPASSRVSAAAKILDTGLKAYELHELVERIEALEQNRSLGGKSQ